MNRIALATVPLVLVALAGCQATSSGGKTAKVQIGSGASSGSSSSPSGSQSSAPSAPTTSAPPAADPHVKFTSSCDYILGNFTESAQGFRFIARASLHNTGNVGAKVAVKASWVQVGSKDITKTKTVVVPFHHGKSVNFTVVVGQDQIDQIQANNGLNDCHVKSTIIGTVGATH